MKNEKALEVFTFHDLSNGILGAQFGVCLPFQPRL
jgi:hypothetical protein